MVDTENSVGTDTTKNRKRRYTVVPFPKIVFFYPLTIVSIVCGILESIAQGVDAHSTVAGTLFIIVFLVNIMVISFDFAGVKALALTCFLIAALFGLLYFEILDNITDISKQLFQNVHASQMLYFMISAILFTMISGGILINLLWNRWTIEPQRLVHKHGLLGDVKEFPVVDLQVHKQIDDVFEYLLLLSGTLTFQPGPSIPTIRLENVPFINRAEKKIQNIIRSKS